MAKKSKTTKAVKKTVAKKGPATKPAPKKPAAKKSATNKPPTTKSHLSKKAQKKAAANKPLAKSSAVKKAPAKRITPTKPIAARATPAAVVASTVLKVGTKAPAFVLGSSTGTSISLGALAGQRVVLYFYPRADTPGCTVQACAFRDAIAAYSALGVPVFGISPDPVADVTKFAKKFDLNFPLLADATHTAAEAYGVWVEKSMYGKKYWGVARTTFVIAANGSIEKVFEKVNPDGHDKEVLAYLKS